MPVERAAVVQRLGNAPQLQSDVVEEDRQIDGRIRRIAVGHDGGIMKGVRIFAVGLSTGFIGLRQVIPPMRPGALTESVWWLCVWAVIGAAQGQGILPPAGLPLLLSPAT